MAKLIACIIPVLDSITLLIEGSKENAHAIKSFEGLSDVLSLAMQHSEVFFVFHFQFF